MDKDIHQVSGTFLREDQAAFIVNPDGSLEMRLPDEAGDHELAYDQLFVLALAVQVKEPGWFHGMIEEVMQFCEENREAIEANRKAN